MPELTALRADSPAAGTRIRTFAASPGSPIRSRPGRWGNRLASWLESSVVPLVRLRRGDPLVSTLARVAMDAREPGEVRLALVGLAGVASGADRVELFRDRGGLPGARLACWPPPAQTDPFTPDRAQARATSRGPIALAIARTWSRQPSTLDVPIRVGDSTFATLRLTAARSRAWPARTVRRLETLCSIAGVAERALARPMPGSVAAEPGPGLQGSAGFDALLDFGLALARRRREPLSVLMVAVDRLAAIRELLGEVQADAAIDRASRAIRGTVRASDALTRLEDGRLGLILPNASIEGALKVAESVRSAIARSGAASTTMAALTASIGVATYPDQAGDAATLRAVASSALTLATSEGQNRVARAPSPDQVDTTP